MSDVIDEPIPDTNILYEASRPEANKRVKTEEQR